MHMRTASSTVLALVAACSGGPESLTVTPDVRDLAADGMTLVELEANVVFRGDAISDGEDVTFTCNQSLLFETREDAEPDVAGGRVLGEQEIETEATGGIARAYMLAPLAAGEVTVTASFTTVNEDVLSAAVTFEVAPPPLIAAGKGDDTNFVSHFDFTCDQVNVGGFVQNRDPIEVTCHLTLKDLGGRDLPHTPVLFFAEAGYIRDVAATERDVRTVTYVIPTQPSQLPRDVDPQPAAEWAGLVAYPRNPTDGLVTLLAVVRGQESFDDRNGNGVLDADESWIDEGEPFLDVDDDGAFTQDTDPEPCCDSNGNGVVDGLNGQWDADVWIGRVAHVLWTGTWDDQASFITPSNAAIDAQGNQSFKVRIADRYFNPVATNNARDNIELSLSTSRALLTPPTLLDGITLEPTTGMLLNNVFPTFRFGTGGAGNPIFAGFRKNGSLLAGREWEFTITDNRGTSSSVCDQVSWSVTATLEYTIAVDSAGSDFDRREGVESASGTLEPLAGDPCL